MTTSELDEQMKEAIAEVKRIAYLKLLEKKDIVRRVSIALNEKGSFTHWTSQRFDDLKIEKLHTYYGDVAKVTIPMGYRLFSIVQFMEDRQLYVTNISTSDDKFVIYISDKEGLDWMNMERRKLNE